MLVFVYLVGIIFCLVGVGIFVMCKIIDKKTKDTIKFWNNIDRINKIK